METSSRKDQMQLVNSDGSEDLQNIKLFNKTLYGRVYIDSILGYPNKEGHWTTF